MSINWDPLFGTVYNNDARNSHQMKNKFVQGENADTWIRPRKKKRDVQVDFKSIQAHYRGDGNKYVWIKESEVLRNKLHYKNERDISFEKFLNNMQSMFTGFEDNHEILTEAQKIRLLLQKFQRTSLSHLKNELQVLYDLD